MSIDEKLMLIYEGPLVNAVYVKGLLNANDLYTELIDSENRAIWGAHSEPGMTGNAEVYVLKKEADKAQGVIDAFRASEKKFEI